MFLQDIKKATNRRHLFSAGKVDNDVDNGVQEFPNNNGLGNPPSTELDGKKLLNSEDKPK